MFALPWAWTDRLLSDVGCAKPWLNTSLPRPLFENEERAFLMSKKKLQKLPQHEVIRVFEGFAGYGGASFGLKRSGLNYRVIGMSEFNPFANKLLEANFPNIKKEPKQYNKKRISDIDILG